jgi:Secretion system C-terminal sorting domain/Bacterial Ig domain
MKFYLLTKKYCAILVLLSFALIGQSQGIVTSYKNLFVGQSFTDALGVQNSITSPPKKGTAAINGLSVTYVPNSNFRGLDTFSVQFKSGSPALWNFRRYVIKTDNSFLTVSDDYAFTTKNQPVTISVIANDNAVGPNGALPLDITNISLVNNGINAIVNANNQIIFTPSTDFVGNAYISYVVCDGFNCATGNATVVVNDNTLPAYTFTRIATSKNTPVTLLTANNGYAIASNGKKGAATLLSNNAFRYVPNNGFVGKDSVAFYNAATNKTNVIEVEVINKALANKYATDDYGYTPINQLVTVDVLKNDKAIFPYIAGFTQPLPSQGTVQQVNGKLQFTPANNFKGIAKFTYQLGAGLSGNAPVNEWATAYVVVSNQYPSKSVFNLSTPINTPLVLNYKVPIVGYNFQVKDSTQSGELKYLPGYSTYSYGSQGSVSGYNLMAYIPSNGFIGTEEFELLYCINGNCRTVKFVVDVQPVTPTLPSYCVGDCVWAGDANNDGVVDMTDILPVGFCQGETGLARANASVNWFGQYSNNWNNPFMPAQDLKYTDTNGDGDVTATDTVAIMDNYLKAHNITAEKQQNYKAVPFYFQLLTPNPQIGDYVEVDVLLGKNINPAIDVAGFTLEFLYDEQTINANSLSCNYYANSWMNHNSPTLRLAKKPFGGRFDLGYVRTTGNSASGYGKVAKLGFIIDDDLNGIRDNDGKYSITLNMQGGSTMGSDGIVYDIPAQMIEIPVSAKKTAAFSSESIVTYPNPATDVLNIYINGGYEMAQYEIINLAGQTLKAGSATGRTAQINVQDLNSGIYVVRVISETGVATKKFEVIK